MVNVAVMGCGVVGSGVMRMLMDNQDVISRSAGADVRLTYVLDLRAIEMPEGVKYTNNFDDLLAEESAISVVVETIGGVGVAYKFTKKLLEAGISVVTSNKELVVVHGDELIQIAQKTGAHYLYEASVGGGVPILRPIRTCLSANHIEQVEGIVNGSTNYLLTRMDEVGLSFPAAIAEAKELGYVEENPAADVEGWDARRKIGILANAAFGAKLLGNDQIPTEGIQHITDRDLACARQMGGELRLIAHAENHGDYWTAWVHPALIMKGHTLEGIRDVFNGIVVTGDFVGDVLFYGRGAGGQPTASAIVGDIIELMRGAKFAGGWVNAKQHPEFRSPEHQEEQLMVRIESTLDAQTVIERVKSALPDCVLTPVQGMFVMLTAKKPYQELVQAINSIKTEGIVTGIPVRVLR